MPRILLLCLVTGCAAEVRALRVQPPFAIAPAQTHVSLVSIESADPDLASFVKAGLTAAFSASAFTLVDETGAARTIALDAESTEPEAGFRATLPASLPGEGALVLGVKIVFVGEESGSWTPSGGPAPGTWVVPKVVTDVVYTLWTRDGREVDTRRISLSGIPNRPFRHLLKMMPSRSAWLAWDDDERERLRFAAYDPGELVRDTLHASAAAFVFPYGERRVWFSAPLDESSSDLKVGLALVKEEAFEAAYQAFEKVSPAIPGAFYDMGVMRELQGRDDEALELYRKAAALPAVDATPKQVVMIQRQLGLVEARLLNRRTLDVR